MRNEEIVRKFKELYPPGMRVRLLSMDDAQAPPMGTKGTVLGVDDYGSIKVCWDTGSSLSVVPGEDIIEIVSKEL